MRVIVLMVCLLGATLSPGIFAQAAQDDPAWAWSEERITQAVNRVRAGHDLNPGSWPGGARVAVLLSLHLRLDSGPRVAQSCKE